MKNDELLRFVTESNRIEGIHRPPSDIEMEASKTFLSLDVVKVSDLVTFVAFCQPGAKLRTEVGMNVRVGNHVAPPGGPDIQPALQKILNRANEDGDPWVTHVDYETLHPFMDGNGRSGRILWAWQMVYTDTWPRLELGFLHAFYYQTLNGVRKKG